MSAAKASQWVAGAKSPLSERCFVTLWRLYRSKPVPAYACTAAVLLLARHFLGDLADTAAGQSQQIYAFLSRVITLLTSIASIVTIALPFQLLFPAVQRKPKITTYEFWLDVFYWHQGLFLQLLSFAVVVEALSKFAWSWTSGPWLPAVSGLPLWLQVVITIWAYDFIVYWRHRSEHTLRALWSFHAVHHSTEQVDVLTTLRLHPFEMVYATLTNAAVLLIGLDPKAAIIGYTLYVYWNYFIHTNVRVRFSGFMKYVFVTPFMHQWHHAMDQAAIGKNVGVVFAWNDWLFGTAYHPEHWPTRFGIDVPDDERIPADSYLRQLVYPLQYAWAQLRRPA